MSPRDIKMPRRNLNETQNLMQQAFQLLDSGYSKQEVAASLNTTVRTIQRWVKDRNYQNPKNRIENALVEIASQATSKTTASPSSQSAQDLAVSNAVQDLEDYHASQRWLALEMGGLGARLLPVLKECLDKLSPEDINPRTLPSLLKAVAELANNSSNCWARATGLEEVINVIKNQQISD